ncbi:MAG: glycine cleavage system protein GcvH [Myxococcota bacterium]|nr:glycine cleavage system protein GcvH [Myxococcota bacterium]
MPEFSLPDENRYSQDDEWVRESGDGLYRIGITDYAQQQLGDVVFVELPEPGLKFQAGQAFGVIESVKAVSDLCMPVSGEIVEVNSELEDAPEVVNEDCYHGGWLIGIRIDDAAQFNGLMESKAYGEHIASRSDD